MNKKIIAPLAVAIVLLLAGIAYLGYKLNEQKQVNKDMQELAELDKQEKCFAYWTAGQGKEGVIAMAGKYRVSRNNVFEYYKRELKSIGVKSADEFIALLKRRERRLSRSHTKS